METIMVQISGTKHELYKYYLSFNQYSNPCKTVILYARKLRLRRLRHSPKIREQDYDTARV